MKLTDYLAYEKAIPYVRNIGADHQKISLPIGLPKSASP